MKVNWFGEQSGSIRKGRGKGKRGWREDEEGSMLRFIGGQMFDLLRVCSVRV